MPKNLSTNYFWLDFDSIVKPKKVFSLLLGKCLKKIKGMREKFLRISLYLTDDDIAQLYICIYDVKFRQIVSHRAKQ